MKRRSFMGAILAACAAPAIVRASSLFETKEAPQIILHKAQDIVIATEMPTQEIAKKLWQGADFSHIDDDYDGFAAITDYHRGDTRLYIRGDGIIVMCSPSQAAMAQGGPWPLTPYDGVLRDNPKRYPSGKRLAAESRFNFVLGTFR